MKPATQRKERLFKLNIDLPPPALTECAWDLVASVEREDIMVVDPHNRHALDEVTDSDGAILVNADATLAVKLADWLSIGCQRIRWEHMQETEVPKTAYAMYTTNIRKVFGGPFQESAPLGPAAFVGEIVIRRQLQRAMLACAREGEAENSMQIFQFIIAHELAHVFDALKYLVPAFMDWRKFYKDVLCDGTATEAVYSRMGWLSGMMDEYGYKNELGGIQQWWPSRAEQIFKARDLDWSILERGG